MKNLLGKHVRFSVTAWGEKGPEANLFRGRVTQIEGTLIFIEEMESFGQQCPNTWHNTASMLFNWIQKI